VAPSAGTAPPAASSTADDGAQRAAEQFAAALRESETRDRQKKERQAAAKAREDELADARGALDRAIAAVRTAKASGTGAVEADTAWKAAKAKVIELETGQAPSWAASLGSSPQVSPDPASESPGDD
jgi:hypothetical protein